MDIEIDQTAILNEMMKDINSIVNTIVPKIINKGGNLLHNTYRKAIDQYYLYPTELYDRHGEGIGTKTGWNLYNADQSYTTDSSIQLQITESGLSPYQGRSTGGVLEDVLETGSVPKRLYSGEVSIEISEAEGSFNTGAVSFSGTPGSVMDQALQHIEGRYMQYFKREWNKEILGCSSFIKYAKM